MEKIDPSKPTLILSPKIDPKKPSLILKPIPQRLPVQVQISRLAAKPAIAPESMAVTPGTGNGGEFVANYFA